MLLHIVAFAGFLLANVPFAVLNNKSVFVTFRVVDLVSQAILASAFQIMISSEIERNNEEASKKSWTSPSVLSEDQEDDPTLSAPTIIRRANSGEISEQAKPITTEVKHNHASMDVMISTLTQNRISFAYESAD